MFPRMIDRSSGISEMSRTVALTTIMGSVGDECYLEWQRPRPVSFEDAFEVCLAAELSIS